MKKCFVEKLCTVNCFFLSLLIMSMCQQKKCLLCTTENLPNDDEFSTRRAYFSVPKLQELRVKWNEAIAEMHPILKQYVDNINTYKICDLHFKDSDIKKNYVTKLANGSEGVGEFPISRWTLQIKALPMNFEELKHEKTQNSNLMEMLQEENRKEKTSEENHPEKTSENGKQEIEGNINVDYYERQSRNNSESDEIQEIGRSPKLTLRTFRPDFRKQINIKYSPYPIPELENNGVLPQILQIKPGKSKGQVIVIPPAIRGAPVISQGQPLLAVPSIAKFVPVTNVNSVLKSNSITNVFPMTQVPKITNVRSLSELVEEPATVVTKVIDPPPIMYSFGTKVPKITNVRSLFGVTKEPVTAATKVNDPPPIMYSFGTKVSSKPEVDSVRPPSPTPSQKKKVVEPYDKDKLKSDLQGNPLPKGWAYTFAKGDDILFTQYSILRRFPIFLLIEDDMTTKVSIGHQPVKFIPHEVELNCYSDVANTLKKMESLSWCLGIGFSNNNHSDFCSILIKRLNSRCEACSTIRRNEQRQERAEIERQQKPKKDFKIIIRRLKRVNERLEAKLCKMKLMITHLKNKQCVDCLHEKFVKRNSAQVECASTAASTTD